MTKYIKLLLFTFFSQVTFTNAQEVQPEIKDQTKFYGKEFFLIEGVAFPGSLRENTFDRLPKSYKDKVASLWDLSKNSAGISVRFLSNSEKISVKWTLLNNSNMVHMALTGIEGVDLYCKVDNNWQYVNTTKPDKFEKENEVLLIDNMKKEWREYKMYLPLYDGVIELEVGIDSLSEIIKPEKIIDKPIVFYGSSITQGGCASRPGMMYTSIISRKLNMECLNLGFSGNGKMEPELAEFFSGIDAKFYVFECVPNMTLDEIRERVLPFVEIIRRNHPATPIVFIEGLIYERAFFNLKMQESIIERNRILRDNYDKLIKAGSRDIYYINNKYPLGTDHEATVDGVHFTDLGFMRYADYLITKFEEFGLIKK